MRVFPVAALLSLALGACVVGPDYERPKTSAPQKWSETLATPKPADVDKWWQGFNDPLLNQLISDAIAANLDLKKALERVKDARTVRSQTIAGALPALGAKSFVNRRFNNSTAGSGAAGVGGTSNSSSAGNFTGSGGNSLINIFQLGFDAQWELDFFGGVQRALEAADATIDSEVENSRDVLVTLLGEIARNYIELRASQTLIAITQENLAAAKDTEGLTNIRQQSGLANMLEVTQAQAQVATIESSLPTYQTQVKQAIHALSVLLGKEPEALTQKLEAHAQTDAVPAVALVAIPDLPSELLQRRPDIRRAERLMAAANAYVGVATSELYPKINLAAFIGLQNTKITDFTLLGKSWSTASTLTIPLFNWGKLQAAIKSKKIQSEEAVLTYQSTVLAAFQDVEDALVAYVKEQQRNAALTEAVKANQLAVQLAKERYKRGLTGFIDVLQTQQALYQAQSNEVSSKAAISSDLVALYKALGGGWQTEASVKNPCANDKSC